MSITTEELEKIIYAAYHVNLVKKMFDEKSMQDRDSKKNRLLLHLATKAHVTINQLLYQVSGWESRHEQN